MQKTSAPGRIRTTADLGCAGAVDRVLPGLPVVLLEEEADDDGGGRDGVEEAEGADLVHEFRQLLRLPGALRRLQHRLDPAQADQTREQEAQTQHLRDEGP